MSEKNVLVGMIIIAAIALMIGASAWTAVGSDIGTMTKTFTITNQSVTTGANGAYVDLTGQELIGVALVNNHTCPNANADGTGCVNVTISEGISTVTGYKRIRMLTNNATWATKPVNVTYTYGAEGYVDDAGGRAIVPLILVFFAVLLVVIALTPALRSGLMDFYDRVRG